MAEPKRATILKISLVVIPLVFSLIALVFSFPVFRDSIDSGKLIIYRPSGYCIIRGFRVFPSDHLLLPIFIENTGKGTKTVQNLQLSFIDPYADSSQSEQKQYYNLAGYIPRLDAYEIGNVFEISHSITVSEHSLEHYLLVFHPDEWWEPTNKDYIYQFHSGEDLVVHMQLSYYEFAGDIPNENSQPINWQDAQSDNFLSMKVYGAFDLLTMRQEIVDPLTNSPEIELSTFAASQPTGDYNADCFATRDFPNSPS